MRSRVRAERARKLGTEGSALVSAFVLLLSQAAFAQGPMGPGGGAMTPQPRVAPAAPQAPTMTPQAPVVTPRVAPPMPVVAPSVNQPVPQPQTRTSVDSSNRDHIDQDAQTDIKKLRVINNSETDTATVEGQYSRTTGAPTGPAKPMPNFQNNPIPGIDVVVQKKPCCPPSTVKTDAEGKITLKLPEAGNYDVALPNVRTGGAVSMTTFVNGKLASRTDFPVGSSVGTTLTVASARDTIILKFETNLGTTPVSGTGGSNPTSPSGPPPQALPKGQRMHKPL